MKNCISKARNHPIFIPFFFIFFSNLSKMLTRSAKRKLHGEEDPQVEAKCRKSAQLVFLPINEICERYPLVGEIIFGYLDDKSLKQCRKVCTTWSTFLDSKTFYWTRMLKNYIGGQEEFLDDWNSVFKKMSMEFAKPFALYISRLCRNRPDYFEVQRSPLLVAITQVHSPFFEYIYEKVIEKNPKDRFGRVPLHVAAYNNNLRVCKFIHEKGYPLDPRSHDGSTPLHDAASYGHLYVFKYLFELVDEKNPQDYKGKMPIHRAAKKGHFEVFKFIYGKSENKNPQDNKGWMPIHHAASTGRLEICKFIHERGNNLNPLSNDGKTPLTVAAINGHFEVSRFIFGVVKQALTEEEKAEVVTLLKAQMNDTNLSKLITLFLE